MELGFVVVFGGFGGRNVRPRTRGRVRPVMRLDGGDEIENKLREQMRSLDRANHKLNEELEKIRKEEGVELSHLPDQRDRVPGEHLGVKETVQVQLQALQRNDYPEVDAGIATAFEFAAPMNRMSVGGTAEKFAQFVYTSIYAMLLNCKDWVLSDVTMTSGGRRASVVALVTGMDGRRRKFLWNLGRGKIWHSGTFEECWLVDAVISADHRGRLQID